MLEKSNKNISQAVSISEQEARGRILKKSKEKNASRRSSAIGLKTKLQYEPKSFHQGAKVAAATNQEIMEGAALRILKEKDSFDTPKAIS